jgi:hypothetical protein
MPFDDAHVDSHALSAEPRNIAEDMDESKQGIGIKIHAKSRNSNWRRAWHRLRNGQAISR